MVAAVTDSGEIALELTFMSVFDEVGLADHVETVTEGMDRDQLLELVTLLAACAGATYEAWADDVDRPVHEMLQAAGLFYAQHRDDLPTDG